MTTQLAPTLSTVEIESAVRWQLCQLAFECFTSRPKEFTECAGLLVGSTENAHIHVTGFLRTAESGLSPALATPADLPAGVFRIDRRRDTELLSEDECVWQNLIPGKHGVFLLVKPITVSCAEALLWAAGASAGDPPVQRLILKGRPQPPARAPISALPVDRVKAGWKSLVSWRPRMMGNDLKTIGWASVASLLLLMAYQWLGSTPLRNLPQAGPGPTLELFAESNERELGLRWKATSPSKEPVHLALLTVREGYYERTIDLTTQFSPEGRITVRPQEPDVSVTLRIHRKGERPLTRTITYLGFEPDLALPSAPPPVTYNTSSADSSEFSRLRARNRELEDAIAALRRHGLRPRR